MLIALMLNFPCKSVSIFMFETLALRESKDDLQDENRYTKPRSTSFFMCVI